MNSDIRQTTELFQVEAELHLLQKDRRKYQNNTLIDYLNINSVRNKIADLRILAQRIHLIYRMHSQILMVTKNIRELSSLTSLWLRNKRHARWR